MKNIYIIDLSSYKMTEIKDRKNTYKIEEIFVIPRYDFF